MLTLLRVLHFGRLPDEQERHRDLLKKLRTIMATQAEIAAELRAAKDRLVAADARITKVGIETDKLIQTVKDLEAIINAGTVSQELADALAAVNAQIGVVESTIGAVDEKVPDETPPPTP